MLSFDEAYQLTLDSIQPLPVEAVALLPATGRIVGQDCLAKVDVPSIDISLKDGYAVQSTDIGAASSDHPVTLTLVGSVAAGGHWENVLHTGEAVRILSGAPLPQGANAIVAEEFTNVHQQTIHVMTHAEPGRNILQRGTDIQTGQLLVPIGQRLTPTNIGLLAAGGYQDVIVYRRPRVAILATGDEVLAPGQPLVPGKLYASNLFTLAAWCLRSGFEVDTFVLPDDEARIRQVLTACLEQYDAVLTSGGAWKGERDLVVKILDTLGWQKLYHRVRMGPGKAVGFGLFDTKPVICLPGGPPSNHMAFIQLGLPGLQKLSGDRNPGLPLFPAMIADTVTGQLDWTQFVHGHLVKEEQCLIFQPLKYRSRLQEMAHTEAIAKIPEGQETLSAHSTIMVQVLGASS